jgi:hypothetical protein
MEWSPPCVIPHSNLLFTWRTAIEGVAITVLLDLSLLDFSFALLRMRRTRYHMVRVPENKQDKKRSSLPFGRNSPDFCLHLTHRAVHGDKQRVVSNSATRVRVSPGWFWYQNDQNRILTPRALFVARVVVVLGARPHEISHHSQWIGNDMGTNILFLWWLVKILQIYHFSPECFWILVNSWGVRLLETFLSLRCAVSIQLIVGTNVLKFFASCFTEVKGYLSRWPRIPSGRSDQTVFWIWRKSKPSPR